MPALASGRAARAPARTHAREGLDAVLDWVRREVGTEQADALGADPDDLDSAIGGRWDVLMRAVRKVRSENKRVRNFRALVVAVAKRMAVAGPPPIVAMEPKPGGTSEQQQAADRRAKLHADLVRILGDDPPTTEERGQ